MRGVSGPLVPLASPQLLMNRHLVPRSMLYDLVACSIFLLLHSHLACTSPAVLRTPLPRLPSLPSLPPRCPSLPTGGSWEAGLYYPLIGMLLAGIYAYVAHCNNNPIDFDSRDNSR